MQPPLPDFANANYPGDAEPFSMCMVCLANVESGLSECPKCHVPLSLVRKCPGCSKIVSALHGKCVYCGSIFVSADTAVTDKTVEPPNASRGQMIRKIRAAAVTIGVFTLVFTVTLIFSRRLEQRRPAPRSLSRIGTSYALRRASFYATATMDTVPTGHVRAADKVEVIDFETAGTTVLWWHVRTSALDGFVQPADFAPPKVSDAERGYRLLRSTILGIDDPDRMAMAIDAVQYYRTLFPKDGRNNELLYSTAERAREVGRKSSNAELLKRSREMYQLLRTTELSEKAYSALENFPTIQNAHAGQVQKQPSAPGLAIIGAERHDQSSSAVSGHKFLFVNQTELSILLPTLQRATAGMMLEGHTARDLTAGNTVVPAGTLCELKILRADENAPDSVPSAVIQMTGLQVSGRLIAVNAAPIRVSIPSGNDANQSPPVNFRLKTPLLLPE